MSPNIDEAVPTTIPDGGAESPPQNEESRPSSILKVGFKNSKRPSTEHAAPLGEVSQRWDLNGDGILDETERALRDRDTTGKGFLKEEELYDLMSDNLKTQKELFKFKKVVIGLVAFTVILALSNLGTSFAAAFLAKDTTTKDGSLVDAKTGDTLGSQSTNLQYDAAAGTQDQRARRESTCTTSNEGTDCTTDSFLTMSVTHGKSMVSDCKRGKTVVLNRGFSGSRQLQLAICPLASGYTASYTTGQLPTATINTPRGVIEIKPNAAGTYYEITGNGITSNEGQFCDSTADCDTDLDCDVGGKLTCFEPQVTVDPTVSIIAVNEEAPEVAVDPYGGR